MKIFVIASAVAILIMGAIGAWLFRGNIFEFWLKRKLSPELRAEYEEWKTRKLVLPPEALVVTPFSKETQAAARNFYEACKKQKEAAKKVEEKYFTNKTKGQEIGPDRKSLDYAALSQSLGELEPFIQSFTRLAAQPDYELTANVTDELYIEKGAFPRADYVAIRAVTRLLYLKTLALLQQGKTVEALAAAEIILQASRTNPYDCLVDQMIGVNLAALGTSAWREAVGQCSDVNLLRRTLAAQNLLAQRPAALSGKLPPIFMETLGSLRYLKRRGIKVECASVTGRELQSLEFGLKAQYLETMALPKIQNNPKLVASIKKDITDFKRTALVLGGVDFSKADRQTQRMAQMASPMLFDILAPSLKKALPVAQAQQTQFNQLRLATARKLYALEHGKPAVKDSDLVPQYLAALPAGQ